MPTSLQGRAQKMVAMCGSFNSFIIPSRRLRQACQNHSSERVPQNANRWYLNSWELPYTWQGYTEVLERFKVARPRIVGRPKTRQATLKTSTDVRKRVFLKSPVLENRTPGSVRGPLGNWRSYRDGFTISGVALVGSKKARWATPIFSKGGRYEK